MAMQMNFTDQYESEVINGYVNILNVTINKEYCFFSLGFYHDINDSLNKKTRKHYSNSFNNMNVSGNIWQQIYDYCKTLPEFQNAIDII